MLANLGVLLVVALIAGVFCAPADFTDDVIRAFGDKMTAPITAALILFSTLWMIFLERPILISVSWVFLKAARGDALAIRDMFSVFKRNYWSAVGAGLAGIIVVVLGLALLIVPGIYLHCRLAFVFYLVIDRRMNVREAFSTSWAMTKGHGWTIFGMSLLAALMFVGGVLVPMAVGAHMSLTWVGAAFAIANVLVVAMWMGAAFSVLYHSIELKEGIPVTEATCGRRQPWGQEHHPRT